MKRSGLLLVTAALAMLFAGVATVVGQPEQAEAVTSADPGKIVFIGPGVVSNPNPYGPDYNASDIYMMNPDGTGVTRVTGETTGGTENTMQAEGDPMLSPDGRKIVFSAINVVDVPIRASHLYVINTDGSGLIRLPAFRGRSPVWSPDGSKVAFVDDADQTNYGDYDPDIFVTNADGSGMPVRVTNTPSEWKSDLDWSPDGKQIVYAKAHDNLYTTSVDGFGTPQQLTSTVGLGEVQPRWSPDGFKLAYIRSEYSSGTETRDLYVMNADGSGQRPLFAEGSRSESDPSWTSDGKLIFVGSHGGSSGLFKTDADGTNVTLLTSDLPPGGQFRWGPSAADDTGVHYDFAGFYSPVDNPDVLNRVKAGSAIPVKFSLGGDMGLDVFAEDTDGSGYPKSGAMACDSTDPVDAIEQTVSAGASGLTYDAATDRYTYVWKTQKAWTGCRQLVVKFDDGTVRRANFKLVK